MGRFFVLAVFAFTVVTAGACNAQARRGKRNVSPNGEYSFQVESGGRALPTYTHRGRTYVEGRWGRSYQIRVFNHTGRRVEAVVSVDGRDAISGQVGNYRSQRGYVIQPYDSVLIEGFRTSWSNVATFRFTDVGDSYAARMGDATNVGVIGVAVFKERTYRPPPRPPIVPYRPKQRLGTRYGGGGKKSSQAPAGEAAPAPSYEMDDLASSGADGYGAAPRREKRSQNLGTQYGEDTYSPSTNTHFERRSTRRPDALLAVRYDDRQGLIARGVLPRPRPQHRPSRRPNPFPNSPEPGFAPPPPSYYWE